MYVPERLDMQERERKTSHLTPTKSLTKHPKQLVEPIPPPKQTLCSYSLINQIIWGLPPVSYIQNSPEEKEGKRRVAKIETRPWEYSFLPAHRDWVFILLLS